MPGEAAGGRRIDGIALAAIAAGAVFLYGGVTGRSILGQIQATLQGKSPATAAAANPITAPSIGSSSASGSSSGSAAAAPANVGGNAALGKMLAAARGWTGSEWDALYQLWQGESGWNNRIWNGGSTAAGGPPAGSSGAYGIPQALPYSKMPRAAWPPGNGGQADPRSQIEWGLGYIASTYGTPSAALAFDQANGGY